MYLYLYYWLGTYLKVIIHIAAIPHSWSLYHQRERRIWKSLSTAYRGFVIHRPEWRSDVVVKLIEKLDKRYETSRQSKEHCKPREQRRIGSPSCRPPPKSAPTWATKSSTEDSSSSRLSTPTTPVSVISNSVTSPPPSSSQSTPIRTAVGNIASRSLSYFEEAPCSDINDDTIDNPSDEDLDIMIRAATGCNFWLNRQDFLAKETCSTAYYRINCNLALFPNKLVFWPILHMCNEYAIKNYASAITYYYSQECIWSGYWRAAQGLVHTSCSAS